MRRPTSTDFRNAADVSVGNGLVSGLRQVSCIASGLPIFGRELHRMSDQFQNQLVDFLPKMGTWALALTRNRAAADDLVQDVAAKALAAEDSFTPGTNFSAWVHRIIISSAGHPPPSGGGRNAARHSRVGSERPWV